MAGLFRSLIFVPGNNPRFLEKSKSLRADMVCLDLEDSVPDGEKLNARVLVGDAIRQRSEYDSQVHVRVNSPASGHIPDDLDAILIPGLDGLVIPKVNNAAELLTIERAVAHLEEKRGLGETQLAPSIESAEGVVNCYNIASSSKRIRVVVFGVFDLLHDLNIEYVKQPEGARYARAKIPLETAAAGVAAIDAIWQDIDDEEGLLDDCKMGRDLGYAGKSIIHPSQIPPVHEAFHPNATEIEWARRIRAAYESSVKMGRGTIAIDGKMIDRVHYDRAVALLALAEGQPQP